MESGCPQGRGTEADPSPLSPGTPGAFLELRQRRASGQASCPGSAQLGSHAAAAPAAEGRPHSGAAAQGRGAAREIPSATGLRLKQTRGPGLGKADRAQAAAPVKAARSRDSAEKGKSVPQLYPELSTSLRRSLQSR